MSAQWVFKQERIVSCATSLTLGGADNAVEEHDLKEIHVVVFNVVEQYLGPDLLLGAWAAFSFAASMISLISEAFAALMTASCATVQQWGMR